MDGAVSGIIAYVFLKEAWLVLAITLICFGVFNGIFTLAQKKEIDLMENGFISVFKRCN